MAGIGKSEPFYGARGLIKELHEEISEAMYERELDIKRSKNVSGSEARYNNKVKEILHEYRMIGNFELTKYIDTVLTY